MKYIKIILIFSVVFLIAAYLGVKMFWKIPQNIPVALSGKVWPTQAIDTVKYSRDLAREKSSDPAYDAQIEEQVSNIAATGATHIALGTPYDEEFVPYLTRWVNTARRYKLNIWFRGNLSGWEGWFGYQKISREEHTAKTVSFVKNHPNLFSDGDIFTSCPECENGGEGDPRLTGDVEGFRSFLINENNSVKDAFKSIRKNVVSGYYSMNGDVAKLIMDKDTTAALGGVATIDHYVETPDQLISYINDLSESSGGKIVLGEWGAPIPDINGKMTEKEQADWIKEALSKLSVNTNVVGLNYWTSKGSSTELWTTKGVAKLAVQTLTSFYTPRLISGVIQNEVGNSIYGVKVASRENSVLTDFSGRFKLEVLPSDTSLSISGVGYYPTTLKIDSPDEYSITLVKENENMFFSFAKKLHQLFQ